MKKIVCEMCGSSDLLKNNGVFECQSCGTKYTVEEAKKMMIEGTIDVKGTVKIDTSNKLENLYILARRARDESNSKQAARYYEEISLEKPTDWEAQFYKVYFTCMQTKKSEIRNSCINLSKTLKSVFLLIDSLNISKSNKISLYVEIYNKVMDYKSLISINMDEEINKCLKNGDLGFANKIGFEQAHSLVPLLVELGDNCLNAELKQNAIAAYKMCMDYIGHFDATYKQIIIDKIKSIDPNYTYKTKTGGCYIATCVYGSYDCPEVWTLRRFRDYTLTETWYGRLFIKCYYVISPIVVKCFGNTKWFKKMWKGKLDKMVAKLQGKGVENTPYNDRKW